MSKRSQKVIITPEARALRELRLKAGLSMRVAGEKLGYSSSYISQIENGRENVPASIKLDAFLEIYKSTNREFKALAKKTKPTDYELIQVLLPKLSTSQLLTIRQLIETMVQA